MRWEIFRGVKSIPLLGIPGPLILQNCLTVHWLLQRWSILLFTIITWIQTVDCYPSGLLRPTARHCSLVITYSSVHLLTVTSCLLRMHTIQPWVYTVTIGF